MFLIRREHLDWHYSNTKIKTKARKHCQHGFLRIWCKTYTRLLAMYKKIDWPLTLYFDGDCPLCAREVRVLRARAAPERLLFVDIRNEVFDAAYLGFTHEDMESLLHARFSDGTWVMGLDATLWAWRAAGMGAWVAPLSWRFMRPLFNLGYRLFCRSRPYLAWLPHPDGGRRCNGNSCMASDAKTASDKTSISGK